MTLDERAEKPGMVENRPEWIWYCESTSGVPVVTFGRWPKHPQQRRYKLADIQPTEHDHPYYPRKDLIRAARAVEEWWVEKGMKAFEGAPYAIFALRGALDTLKSIREDILDNWLPDSASGDELKADMIRRIDAATDKAEGRQ